MQPSGGPTAVAFPFAAAFVPGEGPVPLIAPLDRRRLVPRALLELHQPLPGLSIFSQGDRVDGADDAGRAEWTARHAQKAQIACQRRTRRMRRVG